MKKLKLIKDNGAMPLKKLNEGQALKNPNKYVFQGVFTACSTPEHKIINRNGRIYMKNECLRHLGYLRDMIKENNGRLLGELDHPEGRFDVQMKEASHMITDLWFDENTNCIMGKLEVLDTPNGKTLKSLIDAGFPLYVSSRAAGDVNEKTKEVEIAQIFTYDVVCTPGFKEARLERLDESVLTDKALKYINESISVAKIAAPIEVPMTKIDESIALNYNNVKVTDVCNPINEDTNKDEKLDPEKDSLNDVKNFLPIMKTSSKPVDNMPDVSEDDEESEEAKEADKKNLEDSGDDSDKKEDEEKEELSDEEKEANRELIVSISGFDVDGNKTGDDASEDNDKREDIEDIKAVEGDDEDGEKEEKEQKEEKTEEESTEEANESKESKDESDKKAKEMTSKKDKLKKDTDADIAELESILDSVNKSEAVKESIVRKYPFAISLSDKNFAKFASLRPKLQERCQEFIEENEIFDVRQINELWLTPLKEEQQQKQNWLKLASPEDIELYCNAPISVQNAIEEAAQMYILENMEDIENFWNSTGLRQAAHNRAMNEKIAEEYKKAISENAEQADVLGYSPAIISLTEQYFNL